MDPSSAVPAWMTDLIVAIDKDGVAGMWNSLDEQVRFRFGSFPEGRGREQLAAVWARWRRPCVP